VDALDSHALKLRALSLILPVWTGLPDPSRRVTTTSTVKFRRLWAQVIGIAISHVVFSQQCMDVGFLICSNLS
jgi:hypothetical protein